MSESAAVAVSEPTASRTRLAAARVLTVFAVLLAVVSVVANFVKREALDEAQFRETSHALVADASIRDQVAATLVDTLYANAEVSAALQERLPPNLKALAGPIAATAREAADRSARRLLERPRVQDLFVNASSAAQQQFVAVLNDDKTLLRTTDGKVVLDVRPLVLELGNRLSFIPNLDARIPEGGARITILESGQLKTAQDATKLLRFVADWIWVLGLAAAAGAVWLARGRRRREVRAIAVGVLIAGFLILIVRTLAGRYLIGHLVASDSVRPAVQDAYDTLTNLLRGDGWTAIIIALVALVGVWVSGPGPRPTAARRWVSPYLRRPEIAYTALVVGYLLLLWWQPTPQFGFPRSVIVWFLLAVLGLEVLRRQTAREFPDAEHADLVASARGALGRAREPRTTPPETATADQLVTLSTLHADGSLDDAEFTAAKAQLLEAGPR